MMASTRLPSLSAFPQMRSILQWRHNRIRNLRTSPVHTIVCLDEHVPTPTFDFPHRIQKYLSTSQHQVRGRILDATIICTSIVHLRRETLQHASRLQLIACTGTGIDHIDHEYVRAKGIVLTKVPDQCTTAVAQHAFALQTAVQRKIVQLDKLMRCRTSAGDMSVFSMFGSVPRLWEDEVAGIVGYGAIGKKVEQIASILGMRVLIAEHKDAAALRGDREPFEEVLKQCTTLFITCPLTQTTMRTLNSHNLCLMKSSAIIINVSRGAIVDESAVAKALRNRKIAGLGTDVLESESATALASPLLDSDVPNVVITPHVAWFSSRTLHYMQGVVKEAVEGFVKGNLRYVVDERKE